MYDSHDEIRRIGDLSNPTTAHVTSIEEAILISLAGTLEAWSFKGLSETPTELVSVHENTSFL